MNLDNENEIQNVELFQNQERNENERQKKKKANKRLIKVYPTFILLLFLNISIYLLCKFYSLKISELSISLYTILIKNQYYRIITHHFLHYGICHLLIEIFFSFNISKSLEKTIGTFYSFIIIFIMIIMTSIFYISIILFFKIFNKLIDINYNGDFMYECGMTSLLFSLYSYIFEFRKNKNKRIKVFNIFLLRMRFSSFKILFFLSLFTPNTTFLGNLCGIYSAYIIRIMFSYSILPKYEGVYDFEKYLNLHYNKNWYISIVEPNQEMKEFFSEIFTNIDFQSLEQKKEEFGVQMKEIENENEQP